MDKQNFYSIQVEHFLESEIRIGDFIFLLYKNMFILYKHWSENL